MALISGARPLWLPALAMSAAAGWGAELDTWYTMPPTSSTQRTPAIIHARRSDDWVVAGLPTGVPHR
jgi:hypothetical protein